MAEAGGGFVVRVDDGGEPLGYLAVDATVGGRAHGGLRLRTGLQADEIRLLARTMTYKYGFLGLPLGGAKAGVVGDPEAEPAARRARLERFGRALAPLLRARVYVPAPDMGTDNLDIRRVLAAAGVRVHARQLRVSESGRFTARSVLACARAAAAQLGWELSGRTAAIEGLGKVGAALAGLLAAAGVRVVAVSTARGARHDPDGLDVPALSALAASEGSRAIELHPGGRRIEAPRLLEVEADLLFPCAGHHTLTVANAGGVRAGLICPGANAPLTAEAEAALEARGVLIVPDFVANCGGVLGTVMAYAGLSEQAFERALEGQVAPRLAALLVQARARGLPPRRLAAEQAERRFAQLRTEAERRSPARRLVEFGLSLHRRGLAPAALVRPFARRAIRRSLSEW